MKVVIATGIFPPDVGGPATFVPMIAEAWSRQGHEVTVVTYSDRDDAVERPYRVERVSRALPLPVRYFRYFQAVWRASRGARTIFAQDPVAAGLPAWLTAALRRRRFMLKCVGDFAWEHARVGGVTSASIEEFQTDASVPLRIKCLRGVQRFIARRADAIIVPSRYLGDLVKSWGVPEGRLRVIYNGVQPVATKEAVEKRPHRIVTAGRLVPWKGFNVLISALPEVLKKVPDASLMIIGDGPDEERLKSRTEALGLEAHVNFVGRLKREEVHQAMQASGVFALVSSYEGFSHLLVEAFMAGSAVVASRAGGNTELIKDGGNGLLVEPGDVRGTAKALLRFLEDSALAESCARQAMEDARRFSVESQIARTSEAVMGGKGLRVVMISRDGSIVDPNSRGAERMRRYGDRLEKLSIVILAREKAAKARLSDRIEAEVIDLRNPFSAFLKAVRAAVGAIRTIDANLVTAQDPFEAGLVAHAAAAWTGRPLAVEEHGGVFLGPHWQDESLKNRLMTPFGLHVLARAAGIRAVSKKILEYVKKRWPGKQAEAISVYSEPIACQPSKERFQFGYVGRLVPQKNLPGLMRAFHTVVKAEPEARLLIVGSGLEESTIRVKAAEYGVGDHLVWRPFDENVAAAYAQIQTLVLPSWYEGWGRVAIEAMQCGIPVIMTDVGCAGEAVRDGKEGRVVPIGDMDAFAQAMLDMLQPSKQWWFSEAAKKRASELESPDALAERLIDFWKRVAGLV